MNKILQFLQNESLRDVVSKNGFPVKVQVPLGYSLKATVTFSNFTFLDRKKIGTQISNNIFEVPGLSQGFIAVSRKEGMKTMESKKKRMAVANVIS